jgi:hypothetical protein
MFMPAVFLRFKTGAIWCNRVLFTVALVLLMGGSLHAQLNFNSGTFNGSYGPTAFSLTPSGGTPPYSFSYAPGAMPIPGYRVTNYPNVPVSFATGTTGALAGVAPGSGTNTTTIRLTDANGQFVDKSVTVVIPVVGLGGSVFSGYGAGDSVAFPLWGVGGTAPYSYAVSSGSLPPGLSLNPVTGLLSGTLTTAGSYTFNIQVTDAAARTFTRGFGGITVSPLHVNSFPGMPFSVLPSGNINQSYGVQLTATGCTGSCTFALAPGNSLPAGLTLSANGLVSGTPVSATFGLNFTMTVTDAANPPNSITRRMAISILPNTPSPLTITSTTARDFPLGRNDLVELFASGGIPPYTFDLEPSSSLPAGAFIIQTSGGAGNPAGSNPMRGFLAAEVLTPGSYPFVLRVTDSAGNIATRPIPWRVTTFGTFYTFFPGFGATGQAIAQLGAPYQHPMLPLGGVPPYTATPVNTVAGLSVANDGLITGTPMEAAGVGFSIPLTVRFTDSAGSSFLSDGNMTFGGPPFSLTLTGGDFGGFQAGGLNALMLTASGSTPPFNSVSIVSGSLPPGLHLLLPGEFNDGGNAQAYGQLAGVPTTPGDYSFVVRVIDSQGNVGQRLIRIHVSAMGFVQAGVASATIGVPYNQTFDVRGGVAPYTFSLSTGALPTGLSMNPSTGAITGTPSTTGAFSVGIRVTDANGDTLTRTYTLNIYNIRITNSSVLPVGTANLPYSVTLTAVPSGPGAPSGPYVWTATGLPSGLTLNSSTGVLSGTPTVSGTFSVTVTAGTSSAVVTTNFTLFIKFLSLKNLLFGLPTASLGDATVGSTFNLTLTPTGAVPPYTISLASGALPPGLAVVAADAVNGTTGFGRYAIAGIPTTVGDYNFVLQYADSNGLVVLRRASMSVKSISLATVTNLKIGLVNTPYSAQLYGSGGSGAFTFALANTLNNVPPPGLTLSSSGLLSGTPTSTGTYTFVVDMTDTGSGQVRRQTVFATFNATGTRRIDVSFGPILTEAALGHAASFTLIPSGGGGVHTWSVGGSLPPGMQLLSGANLPPGFSSPNAVLTGVPTTAGVFSFAIRVDDQTGNFAIRSATLSVTPLRLGPTNFPLTQGLILPPPQVGKPYSFQLTALNSVPPVTSTNLDGGFMPSGVTLNSTGLLSGTPTEAGNFTQPFVMTDSTGKTLASAGTIFVYSAGRPVGVNTSTSVTARSATTGNPYAFNLNDMIAPGTGRAPFVWNVLSGAIPPGLSIAGSVLTGTPTTAGSYSMTLEVTDADGEKSLVAPFNIAVVAMSVSPAPDAIAPAVSGTPYSQTISAAGGVPPYTFRTGFGSDMPVGLSLSAGGVLSGTPTTWGDFSIVVEAVDATAAVFRQTYRFSVAAPGTSVPSITVTPATISATYVIGNPAPSPIPISVGSTSTNFSFTAQATGGSWLSIAPGSGTTPGTINLTFNTTGLAANTYNGAVTFTSGAAVNSPRSIPVTLVVTAPAPCSYSLNPTSSSILAAGGPMSFAVTTNSSSCAWTASTAAPWITVNSPGSGTGTGTVNLSIAANPDTATRTGTVNLQGLTFTVTQFGSACSFTLSPASISVPASGGSAPVGINASSGTCAWTAGGGDAWISVSQPDSGAGSGSVTVSIAANAGTSSRSGAITIAGMPFTVNQAGAGCTYSLNSTGSSVPYSGGPADVSITTSAGCAWTTDPGPGWITVVSGASGSGNGPISLNVAANSSVSGRSATVLIGGQPYQVTQAGVPCSFSMSAGNTLQPASGGNSAISITASGGGCGWVASSNVAWLTLSAGSGTGSQTVNYTAAANANTTARSGTITIAGQNVVITQAGTTCDFALRSPSASMPAGGGSAAVGVVAAAGCNWTAVSNAPFITISGGPSFSGTTNVNFTVQPNTTGVERTGFMVIAGYSFGVTQAPAPCAISLSSLSFSPGEFGDNSSFTYTTSVSGCPHAVQSYSSWITVTTAAYSGTAGSVSFSVAPNGFAAPRTGVIKIGDEEFTVNQAASSCAYVLSSYSATFDRLGGPGSVPMTFSPAACGPPATIIAGPAGMVTLGAVTSGSGAYFQNYTTAIYQSLINYIRTAQLQVNGQIFTVKQTSW